MKSAIASDADYLAAVKAGATDWAQRMVDDAAKAAGYTIGPVYHGVRERYRIGTESSPSAILPATKFTKWIASEANFPAFYASRDKAAVERWAKRPSNVMAVYLKAQNTAKEGEIIISSSFLQKEVVDKLKSLGYDSVEGGRDFNAHEIAVFDSSQIKSADPITYDKSGSVIPLSKRFNSSSEEITNPVVLENEGIPFEHTTTKIEKLEDADISKTSESSYLGQALYGVLEGGSWKPSHLKSGRTLRGTVSGRIIDLTNVTNEDLKRIGKLIGRDIETVPFLTLEKRYGGVGKGLMAAGYSAAIHMGAGAAGRHIAIFDTSKIKSADSSTSSEITNPAGRIPAQFPYEYAKYLKQHFPEIWKLGGNIRGNDAFRWWSAYRQGDRSPTVTHWWAVTRPAWIARHYRDHRIAGVVAQIKWGTIGTLGVAGMKRVIETKIRNSR